MSSNGLTESDEPPSATPCLSFWGPFHPLFGGHTLLEAATSAYFPPLAVFLWRTIFATFLSATLIAYLIIGKYHFQFYSVWCHLGISLAFIASASASALYLLSKPPRTNTFSVLAFAVVLLFQVFATAALFLDLVYWALLFDYDTTPNLAQLAQHAFNLVFVLLDILLSLRMHFKLVYGLIFITYTIAFLIFAWVRFAVTDDWIYNFLDYQNQGAGTTVAYYLGILVWALVASVLMILLSRISKCPCITGNEKDPRVDASIDDQVGDTV